MDTRDPRPQRIADVGSAAHHFRAYPDMGLEARRVHGVSGGSACRMFFCSGVGNCWPRCRSFSPSSENPACTRLFRIVGRSILMATQGHAVSTS
jgi:hypothetical protein